MEEISDIREDEPVQPDRPSSARRMFTLRNNAARQVAVNFMPSRQLPYNTIRLRRNNSEQNALLDEAEAEAGAEADTEQQAAAIVREMEQHRRLMEDHPGADQLRREALRDLPQGLTMKRQVRAKLSASVSLRSKRRPISCWKRMKYRMSFAWKRGKDRFRDFIFSIELWYEAIRNIEGQFGSAVGSYFYFLRGLFAMNLVLAVFIVGFVVVPQLLHDQNVGVERNGGWGPVEFISGKGAYTDSVLFYGHYHAGPVSTPGPLAYSLPFAYFFTMVCLYLAVFGVLCYRTAYSYRRNFIETAGGWSHKFASKVFCGWDFGIVSPQAAALNAASVYNEFKEILNEQNKKKENTTFCTKVAQYLTNIIVNALVIGVIIGLEYGFWQLLSVEQVTTQWEVLLSLAVTAVVALLPVLFNFIVKLEYYRPRTALYVTLARTWLLDVGTLMLLFYYWTQSDIECWETLFGQEAYRLVLLDSLVSLFFLPAIEIIRGCIYKCNPSLSPPEFNIAYNSLTLLYNQVLVWCGALFSPPLVAAVLLKLLLLFYVKRQCAIRACRPMGKIWRASQTQTVLYMLVTLSLFTMLFAFGSLFFKMESRWCGPFREYSHVYEVLSEGVLGLARRPAARRALLLGARPGALAALGVLLCVGVYYMRARALAQRSMVGILRRMLLLQARDKDFLLNAIAKVSNGEWLYRPKPADEGPSSHTWRYLNEVRKPSNAGFQLDASRLSQRPHSYARERPASHRNSDGDTDSSFSWKGSTSCLEAKDVEDGTKKWI